LNKDGWLIQEAVLVRADVYGGTQTVEPSKQTLSAGFWN